MCMQSETWPLKRAQSTVIRIWLEQGSYRRPSELCAEKEHLEFESIAMDLEHDPIYMQRDEIRLPLLDSSYLSTESGLLRAS